MLKDKITICFPESESTDLDLLSLPFKSSYRVLSWTGASDGNSLTPNFNVDDLIGKIMIIKSFKIIPYYQNPSVDMYVSDGVTDFEETIPADSRIDRVFDDYTNGSTIVMTINGGQVNLFNAVFPLDVDLQNIYFKYPEKIQSLSLSVLGMIIENINTGATNNANIKVNMEVYIV